MSKKQEALDTLKEFVVAVEDDRVCPIKACKLGHAAMRIVQPEPAEPVVQEPISDTELEAIADAEKAEKEAVEQEVAEAENEPQSDAPDLKAAIELLDPENDEHWTQGGKPAIAAIEALIGGDTSRAAVESAAPNYDRETAKG